MKILVIVLAVTILALLLVVLFVPVPKKYAQQKVNLSRSDEIIIETPEPYSLVTQPLRVSGRARGGWFFEASFPFQILDADGTFLGAGVAEARSEWMTEDFVPFEGMITYSRPKSKEGILVFKKDNPSGLKELDAEVRVPIRF
ncbi:MAG: Gmad2 immunoglobulin-like domain-containing protein [Patescibacteria group bacterium]